MRALIAFLIALSAAASAAANEVKKKVALTAGEVEVRVSYPDDERKRWAEHVASVVERGLPVVEKAAGFACPAKSFRIEYGEDAASTGGLEARWEGEGKVIARQKGARGGAHGHWVLQALAHAWSEKVALEPWAVEALAHFYVWVALRDTPAIFDSRTYRDELIREAAKAPNAPLDGWKVPEAVGDGGGESPFGYPQAARGMLYLACIERRIGEGTIAQMSSAVSASAPGDTAAIAAQIGQQAGKPVEDLFLGWAMRITDPEKQKPAFSTKSIHDQDDDSLMDFEEGEVGTDPKLNDTDGDGLLDGEEVFDTESDPKAKDAPATKIKLDGDTKEWMRAKKFSWTDRKGDQKEGTKGGDLLKAAVCVDKKYLYLLLESDSFENAQVKYSIAFDNDGNGVHDYIVGFRPTAGIRERWVGDTHGVKDLSWCEWKAHRGIVLRTHDASAELRIPLSAIGNPKKPEILVYAEARSGVLDTFLKTHVDLEKLGH